MSWPTQKLTDLLESCDAGMWGKPAPEGKGLLVLRSTNITNEGNLDFSDVAELNIQKEVGKLKLFNGDILLEKSGGGPDQPVGRVAYFVAPNHRTYSFANFIQRLRAKSDLIDSCFLFYRLLLLHKIGFTKKMQSQTTGIRNLKMSLYLKIGIPLPPLKIQKQIVERLDKIVEAQKLNDGLIQKAEELFRSIVNIEFQNQKKWDMKKFNEVVFFQEGPGIRTRQFRNDGIKMINVGNIIGDVLALENTDKYLDEEEVRKNYSRFLLNEGDIVLASSGVTWGKRAYVFKQHLPLILNTSVIRLRSVDENILLREFLFDLIDLPVFKNQIRRLITGSAQPNFGPYHLNKVKIPIPPLKTQKQIVAKLSAAQDYKKQLLAQRVKLKELFDSALHKLMNPQRTPKESLRLPMG